MTLSQVGDHFNYGVFEHQMMLKGFQFIGIDDMGADKVKKEKIAVGGFDWGRCAVCVVRWKSHIDQSCRCHDPDLDPDLDPD